MALSCLSAFNVNALVTIESSGFTVSKEGDDNSIYGIKTSGKNLGIKALSKVYDDIVNPDEGLAAIMTCSDVAENCPLITGTEVRIHLLFENPKDFNSLPFVVEKYAERANQIGTEMFYVFSQIRPNQ